MEIKKLLNIAEYGSSPSIIDFDTNTSCVLGLTSFSNTHMTIANEDMVVCGRRGDIKTAKVGDIIIKIDYDIFFTVVPGASSFQDIIREVENLKKESELYSAISEVSCN